MSLRSSALLLSTLLWLPGAAWSADPTHPLVPALERADVKLPSAMAGRVLLTELSCTACHRLPDHDRPVDLTKQFNATVLQDANPTKLHPTPTSLRRQQWPKGMQFQSQGGPTFQLGPVGQPNALRITGGETAVIPLGQTAGRAVTVLYTVFGMSVDADGNAVLIDKEGSNTKLPWDLADATGKFAEVQIQPVWRDMDGRRDGAEMRSLTVWRQTFVNPKPDRPMNSLRLSAPPPGGIPNAEIVILAATIDARTDPPQPSDPLTPKAGPRLHSLAGRVHPEWTRQFLLHPSTVKPGTTMPALLTNPAPTEVVEPILHYLYSSSNPPTESPMGDANRGQASFHAVGCVACHGPDPRQPAPKKQASDQEKLLEQLGITKEEAGWTDPTDNAAMPLGPIGDKYTTAGLSAFLLDPLHARPAGRMPNLKLKPEEAADIAEYLRTQYAPPTKPVAADSTLGRDAQLVAKGKQLFETIGCVSCHEKDDAANRFLSPAFDKLPTTRSGCLGDPKLGVPSFSLSAEQIESILWALKERSTKLSVDELLTTTLHRMNCLACHERGKLGGVGPNRRDYFATAGQVDMGDEGRLPPTLTNVGAKLLPDRFRRVIVGRGDVRPHLLARMPMFGLENLTALADQLQAADGSGQKVVKRPPNQKKGVSNEEAEQRETGRLLFDIGCVQCHPIDGRHLPGVIGVDVAGLASRVSPSWFREFLLDPSKVKPRTRMPTFFPKGEASVKSLLDGDADRQLDALWTYLSQEHPTKLPAKIQTPGQFELVPGDRPIVHRTFMTGVGTQALAVGYPGKINVALDTENYRLALAWKGKFVDAHSVWYDRFSPFVDPLGADVIKFPTHEFVDLGQQPLPLQFLGFRLDAKGIPTFMIGSAATRIEATVIPVNASIQRSLTVTTAVPLVWNLAVGKKIEATTGGWIVDGMTITTRTSRLVKILAGSDGEQRLILTITPDVKQIEVTHTW